MLYTTILELKKCFVIIFDSCKQVVEVGTLEVDLLSSTNVKKHITLLIFQMV